MPPPALQFDGETVARSKNREFDGFRAQVRGFRAVTAEIAQLQKKGRSGQLTDAERTRLDELNARVAAELTLINAAIADERADELDRKAMRYLFGASDADLATPPR